MKKILLIAILGISIQTIAQADVTTLPAENKVGMFSQLTVGGMVGQEGSFSFQSISGITLNKRWNFGIGVGVESFRYEKIVPLFLDVKYNLLKGDNSPFLELIGGYATSFRSNYYYYPSNVNYGATAGLSVGMRMFFSKHVGLSSSIGVRYSYFDQTQQYYYCTIYTPENEITQLYRTELKIGLIFR